MTTNSDGGIESYEAYYPVFEAMEEVDMVLNLHGEVPSDADAVCASLRHESINTDILSEYSCHKCRAIVPPSSSEIAYPLP